MRSLVLVLALLGFTRGHAISSHLTTGATVVVQVQSHAGPGQQPGDGSEALWESVSSPDGRHLYLTREVPYPGGIGGGLTILGRDTTTGLVSVVQTLSHVPGVADGLRNLGEFVVSPDGLHAYAGGVELLGSPAAHEDLLNRYARDPLTGSLTFLGQAYLGENEFLTDLAMSRDGAYLYAAGFHDYYGLLTVAARDPVTGDVTEVQEIEEASNGKQFGMFVASLLLSPDDAFVYVAVRNDGNPGPLDPVLGLFVFARDAITGMLTEVQHVDEGSVGRPRFRVRSLALSPDGGRLYVGAHTTDSGVGLLVFNRDAASGLLTLVSSLEANPFTEPSLDWFPQALAVHGAEPRLLMLGLYPSGDAPVVPRLGSLSIGTGTGPLQRVGTTPLTGIGSYLWRAQSSPDGSHVYAVDPVNRTLLGLRNLGVECAAAPVAPCRASTRANASSLTIRLGAEKANRFSWSFGHGQATSMLDFGDPSASTTDYAVCAYMGDGTTLSMGIGGATQCKSGPCWQRTGSTFRHRGPAVAALLRASAVDRARVKVALTGARAAVPTLPASLPAIVQLQSSTGECWGSTFSAPGVRTSTATKFKAVSD